MNKSTKYPNIKSVDSLWDIITAMKAKYLKHRINPMTKPKIDAFDKHYQHILTLDDFQDRYLETIKLMYEVIMQHPMVDGNKRLSAEIWRNCLGEDNDWIYNKLGEDDE